MSSGLYSHTTRAVGTILTAAIYNADHQNHITNQNPSQTGALADTLAEFRGKTDPGGVGSESLPVSLAGEIQRLRYAIDRIIGKGTQWYDTPTNSLEDLSASQNEAGGILSKAINYTVVAPDDNEKTIVVTAAGVIITTPGAVAAAEGFGFWVNNQSPGDITVDGNAAETIDGALTLTIPKGRGVFIQTDGLTWNTGGQNWPENIIVRSSPMFTPMGRLSLATATPFHTADITAQSIVYFTPYNGASIQLFDGTDWKAYTFAEVNQALSDSTKSPASSAVSSIYDMFAWIDGTTFRVTRGPPWATGGGSATARGTGAGSTDLVRVNGVLLNSQAITNGPGAQRGVYVGTIATDASNQLSMKMQPAAAAGGGNCVLSVWNNFNRAQVSALSRDSTDSWVYATATIRAANNNNSNRITAIFGLNEDDAVAQYHAYGDTSNGDGGNAFGIGLDSITAFSGTPGTFARWESGSASRGSGDSWYRGFPGMGSHFFQALERGGSSMPNWYGDQGNPTFMQMGLYLTARM